MKKLYDALKYVIYGSLYVIALKTGFDFYSYKRYPDIYAAYSAPWYTEALLYGILSFSSDNGLCHSKNNHFQEAGRRIQSR